MKIVLLTASPRVNGNSSLMADAFMKASVEKGNEVMRYNTAQMEVQGCRACDGCFTRGEACVFHDDYNEIAAEIETADAIVLASPVYWWNFPSQLKAVIDKFYSFSHTGKDFGGKKCGLLACCEDTTTESIDVMLQTYRCAFQYLGAQNMGEVVVLGVAQKGCIAETDGITRAAEFAQRF